jgi:hypothetical protein
MAAAERKKELVHAVAEAIEPKDWWHGNSTRPLPKRNAAKGQQQKERKKERKKTVLYLALLSHNITLNTSRLLSMPPNTHTKTISTRFGIDNNNNNKNFYMCSLSVKVRLVLFPRKTQLELRRRPPNKWHKDVA